MGNNFPEQSVMFEKVLIPADLSEPSENLVASAGGIKNIREIILLHILDREKQGHGEHCPFILR